MLDALAENWRWLLVRAVAAIAYGITVIVWPGMTITAFVFVFAVYAIVDGVTALAISIDVRALPGFGSLVFEAAVRTGGGLAALSAPDLAATFPRVFAAWAMLTGAADATVAAALRREIEGEWPLPAAGTVSVATALVLLLMPGELDAPRLKWLVGPYALIFGSMLLPLAHRLRQLAGEINAAAR